MAFVFSCFIRITSPFSYVNRNSSWNKLYSSAKLGTLNLAGLVYLSDSIIKTKLFWSSGHVLSPYDLCVRKKCNVFHYFGKFRMFYSHICSELLKAYSVFWGVLLLCQLLDLPFTLLAWLLSYLFWHFFSYVSPVTEASLFME